MPRPLATIGRPLLAAAVVVTSSCDARATTARASHASAATRSAPARMADTLAARYARAVGDQSQLVRNPFLNRQRADALEAMVAMQAANGPDAMQARFMVAQERLLAGQTREAIAMLEGLRRSANITLDARAPQNKPFFDLLAIAYFRLGEQENCFMDPAANVCILSRAARHTKQEGARGAIALYEQMLRAFPDDLGSRWLLNLAYIAVGEYPQKVRGAWRIPGLGAPPDASIAAFPTFANVAHTVGADVEGLSGGVSVADFDGDGLLDIFTTSFGMNDPPHLLVADGKGGYVDRTKQAGLAGLVSGLNNVHADYDNDGHEDVFVMRGAWLGDAATQPNSLLHNRGDGTFEDVTYAAGLASLPAAPTPTAAWADFDLDGRLDLFVGHESDAAKGGTSHRSELWRNNGDGTFTEMSHALGIDVDAFVKGAAWGDVNNDGYPDLYVSILGAPNRLFMNRGGKRFEEVPDAAGASLPRMSFPVWFWDVDDDGWEDLLVLSYDIGNSGALHDAVAREYLHLPMQVEPSRLYHNNGDGTFTDVTKRSGLADKVIFAMGANFGDLDNDGLLDFYVGTGNPDFRSVIPNRMFRGVGNMRFEEVTLPGGFGHLQKGHGAAFADLDRDGDEDVFMVMGGAYQGDRFMSALWENPGWPRRSWIALELEGRTANRSAIGARVTITATDARGVERALHRTVGTGGSFGAGPLQLHVGLGAATRVKRVHVAWPDSLHSTSTFEDLAVGRTYHIVQGAQPVVLSRPPVPFRAAIH